MSDSSLPQNSARHWQSVDQYSGEYAVGGEFTTTPSTIVETPVSRRGFLTALSASMALTAAACRRPIQHLVPAVSSHQTAIPGMPANYASVYSNGNIAYGALVKTREGRPLKIKGNDLHDVNRGRTDSRMQASLLSLYDPDRLRRPRIRRSGGGSTHESAVKAIAGAVTEAQSAGKQAVMVIGDHCSPSFSLLMQALSGVAPGLRFVSMPDSLCDNPAAANKAMLGIDAEFAPDVSKASVIVSVDADFLGSDPLALYHTTRFAEKRRPTKKSPAMSKLISVEAQYSLTGANADTRYRIHPSQMEAFVALLEADICGAGAVGSAAGSALADTKSLASTVATELKKGSANGAMLMVGKHLPSRVHAMAINVNMALGSVGQGKAFDPDRLIPNSNTRSEQVQTLVNDLQADTVHALVFVGVNPEYSADRNFRKAMLKAPFRAAINMYEDETATLCDVSIPGSHWLETWGDAIAIDGTTSVQQPMIQPLNDGVPSTPDTLMAIGRAIDSGFLSDTETYHDYVKASWATVVGDDPFGLQWSAILRDGVKVSAVRPSAPAPAPAEPAAEGETAAPAAPAPVPAASAPAPARSVTWNPQGWSVLPADTVKQGATLLVLPSLTMADGSDGNNAWLLELPDPVTKVTWENVAMMSLKMASDLGLCSSSDEKSIRHANGNIVTIQTPNGTIDAPVWVQPGMADSVVALAAGFGHTSIGVSGNGAGVNAQTVVSGTDRIGYVSVSGITKTGTSTRIASSQDHHTLDDGHGERPVAKQVKLADLVGGEALELASEYPSEGMNGHYKKPLSIVSEYKYKGHRWGMVIDMSACTGCSSCVIACQSENNISVVGKEQVLLGREMHWIRIDRYYVGDITNPETLVEPMLCQHCENAPCENVCPVAATTHSPEGLNEMTYNRCVGTRYCLNNCPYKVRRFNFLDYNDHLQKPADLVFNPDVTMRMRGVMEKCTFCVQRLHEAKWHARDEGRSRVNDGEAVTACQEACPASAIYFGDTNDANSAVSRMRENERGFQVLAELNVRPQVTYLAKVRNH